MMMIYQTDYDKVVLQEPASLLISSVPLNILSDAAEMFFGWIDRNTMPSGIALIDMPGQDNIYRLSAEKGAEKLGWKCQWHSGFRNFYREGDHQYLLAFARKGVYVAKPDKLLYQRYSERTMQHQCEFDAVLIEFLIKTFSEEEDIVLDPFCGTGMVPRTARDLNRYGIGIDQRCPFTNKL